MYTIEVSSKVRNRSWHIAMNGANGNKPHILTNPAPHRTTGPVPSLHPSVQRREWLRSVGIGPTAVFSDHAAERAFDGAHAWSAGLHSARAWAGAQYHLDRSAGMLAPLQR